MRTLVILLKIKLSAVYFFLSAEHQDHISKTLVKALSNEFLSPSPRSLWTHFFDTFDRVFIVSRDTTKLGIFPLELVHLRGNRTIELVLKRSLLVMNSEQFPLV